MKEDDAQAFLEGVLTSDELKSAFMAALKRLFDKGISQTIVAHLTVDNGLNIFTLEDPDSDALRLLEAIDRQEQEEVE